jgi:hypothetical protein
MFLLLKVFINFYINKIIFLIMLNINFSKNFKIQQTLINILNYGFVDAYYSKNLMNFFAVPRKKRRTVASKKNKPIIKFKLLVFHVFSKK